MLLYYITDRWQFPGDAAEKRERLLARIAEAARCGLDFIQLREKDLPPRELERLAREAVEIVRPHHTTKLLINSRIDVALASGADGVHLASNDIPASEARAIWARANRNQKLDSKEFLVAASCHTLAAVRLAEAHGADFAVFAPVFEKSVVDANRSAEAVPSRKLISSRTLEQGLKVLREVCQGGAFPNNVEGAGSSNMPVLALGGVTLKNAQGCIQAGAAGIAAIRLFQENKIAEVVRLLRKQ